MVELEALERREWKRLKEESLGLHTVRSLPPEASGCLVDSTGIELDLNQPASKSAQLLGASQPFTLRVFNMSGQCLIELAIRPPAVPSMQRLAALVGSAMKVSAGRVSLMNGTDKLQLSQDISVLPRQDDDLLELHAIADEYTGRIGTRRLEMRPGWVTAVRLQGPTFGDCRLEVEFAPGEIWEQHSLSLSYKHKVVVRSDIAELVNSTQVADETDLEVSSMTLIAILPRRAMQELLLEHLSVSIRTEAMLPPSGEQTYPRLVAFRESGFQRCSVQNGNGLVWLVGKLTAYWVLDCIALLMSAIVAIMELVAGSPWFRAWLAATLWLPGFIYACRYQAYLFDRKCSICALPACCSSCCCGIVWLWVPLGLLAGTFVVNGRHFLGLMQVVCNEDIPLPFDLETLYLFELYKRDVRLFSDIPRLILLAMVFARQQGSRNESLAGLIATVLAGSVSLVRHRRALFDEAFEYFDVVTMEQVV
ncbi:unnamed protein product [Symbiodinium sp. CCMP2456]|nr:unnamed protein product [Symbiodinium sp. CCMP2456]